MFATIRNNHLCLHFPTESKSNISKMFDLGPVNSAPVTGALICVHKSLLFSQLGS